MAQLTTKLLQSFSELPWSKLKQNKNTGTNTPALLNPIRHAVIYSTRDRVQRGFISLCQTNAHTCKLLTRWLSAAVITVPHLSLPPAGDRFAVRGSPAGQQRRLILKLRVIFRVKQTAHN